MPQKPPFHNDDTPETHINNAGSKDLSAQPSTGSAKSPKNADKTKQEILLSSKKVSETKEKLLRAKEVKPRNSGDEIALKPSDDEAHSHYEPFNAKRAQQPTREALVKDNLTSMSPKSTEPQKALPIKAITCFAAAFLSVVWLGISFGYVHNLMGIQGLLAQQPHVLGGFLAGIFAPISMLWLLVLAGVSLFKPQNSPMAAFDEVGLDALTQKAATLQSLLNSLPATLKENANELSLSTDIVDSDTKRLADLLEGQLMSLNELENMSQKSMQIVQHSLEQDAKNQEVLAETLQDRLIELSAISEMASEKAGLVEQALQSQIETIGSDLTSKLEGKSEAFVQVVEKAKNDIRRAEEALFERHESIHKDFVLNFDRLSGAVNEAKSMLGGLEGDLSTEQEKLSDTVSKFKADQEAFEEIIQSHKESIHSTNDTLESAMSRAKAFMEQDEAMQQSFADTIESKLHLVRSVANDADDRLKAAQGNLDETLSLIERSGEVAHDKANALGDVVSTLKGDVVNISDLLSSRARDTAKTATQITNDLTRIEEGFEASLPRILSQSLEVQQSIEGLAHTLEKKSFALDERLKEQAGQIKHLSRASVEAMGDSVGTLSEMLVEIGHMVESVQGSIDASAVNFTDKASMIKKASITARQGLEESLQHFDKKSQNIIKAADVTARHMKTLEKAQSQMRQEVFMGAAKHVMESLHSLSIDLTRVVDGGIHERMWKAYQSGDIGIFTSYLVSIEDELPMGEFVDKFKREHEFRNYIQSFIGQYESMIEQALKVENGALIATTFNTSDMGKLYRLLCSVAKVSPLTQLKDISAISA